MEGAAMARPMFCGLTSRLHGSLQPRGRLCTRPAARPAAGAANQKGAAPLRPLAFRPGSSWRGHTISRPVQSLTGPPVWQPFNASPGPFGTARLSRIYRRRSSRRGHMLRQPGEEREVVRAHDGDLSVVNILGAFGIFPGQQEVIWACMSDACRSAHRAVPCPYTF